MLECFIVAINFILSYVRMIPTISHLFGLITLLLLDFPIPLPIFWFI